LSQQLNYILHINLYNTVSYVTDMGSGQGNWYSD